MLKFTEATIKKYSKRVGLSLLVIFLVCFSNGCYYLAKGQFTTVDKIAKGKSISLYEKTTIYTLHMGLYMFGWVYAPQAAWANHFHTHLIQSTISLIAW